MATGSQNMPFLPSVTSTSRSQSERSNSFTQGPSTIKTVVTAPPWARDESPSPNDEEPPPLSARQPSFSRRSDVTSFHSSGHPPGSHPSQSRWWSFALQRQREHRQSNVSVDAERPARSSSREKRAGISLRARSMSWIPSTRRRSQDDGPILSRKDKDPSSIPTIITEDDKEARPPELRISLPRDETITIAQTATPGWMSPWTPRLPRTNQSFPGYTQFGEDGSRGTGPLDDDSGRNLSRWEKRKKRFRTFLLTNVYVPLLFRFINIVFTVSALGIAIRIRAWEKQYNIMGIVGSSVTLVIIFAPPTLLHVVSAIYFEYFGRPLGLWRTSHKLAHTLFEVLFICAWSAALSLCFDNFFTSRVPCASPNAVSWYSNLPPPPVISPHLGRGTGGVGDSICNDQLALICLVVIGLIMYCTNLVISLFRIFEKMKYQLPR